MYFKLTFFVRYVWNKVPQGPFVILLLVCMWLPFKYLTMVFSVHGWLQLVHFVVHAHIYLARWGHKEKMRSIKPFHWETISDWMWLAELSPRNTSRLLTRKEIHLFCSLSDWQNIPEIDNHQIIMRSRITCSVIINTATQKQCVEL